MALNGYFGRPGSGKSYSVVEYVVLPALKNGRHVVTNIPLEGETLEQVYGGKVTQLPLDALEQEDLACLLPHGCVAVLDECWRRWPSGQKVNKASQEDLALLKEHRHRVDESGNAMQVVLVTQDPADLASWVRKLIAHSFHMHKLEEVGAANRFGVKVYRGCPTGERIPQKLLIREAYGTYKEEIYQYYQSATQSQSFDVGDEKAMDKRFNLFRSGSMVAIMVFVPLAIIVGLYSLNYFISAPERLAAEQGKRPKIEAPELAPLPSAAELTAKAKPASPVSAPVTSKPSELPPSAFWRVAGYIAKSSEPNHFSTWDSVTGYNNQGDGVKVKDKRLAILSSMTGVRYVPLESCKPYADGFNYFCDVDGERVTPWTGYGGVTETLQNTAGTAEPVRAEQSEARNGQPVPVVNLSAQANPHESQQTGREIVVIHQGVKPADPW